MLLCITAGIPQILRASAARNRFRLGAPRHIYRLNRAVFRVLPARPKTALKENRFGQTLFPFVQTETLTGRINRASLLQNPAWRQLPGNF
jgi:hypothetical protein